MSALHYVFRDEIVNVHALATGGLLNKYSFQIFVCKKTLLRDKGGVPFLLDAKKSVSTRYDLSDTGRWYFDKIRREEFPLKYVAFIECQIEIDLSLQTFIDLTENKFFSIWSPRSPVEYFGNAKTGFLAVFRVYNLKNEIDKTLLSKGRAGRNFLYGLSEDQDLELAEPVMDNDSFDRMKHDLLALLKANNSFVRLYV